MLKSTEQWIEKNKTEKQVDTYGGFYTKWKTIRWLVRFDVRYRVRRIREVLAEQGINVEGQSILDVGFGGGHMLRAFPKSCHLNGGDISPSAVESASNDAIYEPWASANFSLVSEDDVEDLPAGPFDVILSSHTIEHVPSDTALLAAVKSRLNDDGLFMLLVPIEEPHYNPDHIRNYSVETIQKLVKDNGFDVVHCEDSMHVNGHVWKIVTIPSRRRWPVFKPIVDAFRLTTLSMIPYRAQRVLDRGLGKIGVGPRQALLLCRKQSS